MEKVNIYLLGRKAICPACSGLAQLSTEEGIVVCIDCKSRYDVVEVGMTEKELICEKTA